MRRVFIAGLSCAALVGIAVGVSACGSSNNNSETTAALSKAEFLKQGNAICKKGNQEINKAAEETFPRSGGKPSEAELEKFAKQTLIPKIQAQITGVKELGAPEGDEAKVEAIVNEAQAALNKGKSEPMLLVQEGGNDPFKKADELTKEYGLTACGGEEK